MGEHKEQRADFISKLETAVRVTGEFFSDLWAEYLAQTFEHRSVFEERDKVRRSQFNPQNVSDRGSERFQTPTSEQVQTRSYPDLIV